MMTLHVYADVEQRSDEWYALRCGLVTASSVGSLVTVGPPDARSVACPTCNAAPSGPCVSMAAKKAPTEIKSVHDARSSHAVTRPPVYSVASSDTSRGLTTQLVAERITGDVDPTFTSEDMLRGIYHEPLAIEAYAKHHAPVEVTGFMVRREKDWQLGYSPDGLVGVDGLVEVKCPRAKTHLRTILADAVPASHMPQLQAGLLVSGRKWIDFISYRAGMPLFVKRVHPDAEWFDAITAACKAYETTAADLVMAYEIATKTMPATERVDNELGLVF